MRTWRNDAVRLSSEQEIPVLRAATVLVSSEAEGFPLTHIFDETRGPGANYWMAGEPGDQTLILAFHEAHAIRRIVLEVEEREQSRTQEIQVCVSHDGGETYREVVRQEFNFSPDGATWECEDWALTDRHITHVKLFRKPDKGCHDRVAKLTSLVLTEGV